MKTSSQILPGISAIYRLDCKSLLENVALRGICNLPVPVLTALTRVEAFDEAECQCKTQRNGGTNQDTASLKFLSDTLLPSYVTTGFVVTDLNGKSFLIGAKEPPFPQIKVTRRCGSPAGDAAGYMYEVEHTAIKTLIPCVISI